MEKMNFKDIIFGKADNEAMTDDELDEVAGGAQQMAIYYAQVGQDYRCIVATGLAAYKTLTKNEILGLIDGNAPKGTRLSNFRAGDVSAQDAADLVNAINKDPAKFAHIKFHDFNSLQ